MNILQDTYLNEYKDLIINRSNDAKLELINSALIDQFYNPANDFEFSQNVNILRLKCKIQLAKLNGKKDRNAENQLHLAIFSLNNFINGRKEKKNEMSEEDFESAIITVEHWHGQPIKENETTIYKFIVLSKMMEKDYKRKLEASNRNYNKLNRR
jgi:hypothetical protein